jgi:hypothetical protein
MQSENLLHKQCSTQKSTTTSGVSSTRNTKSARTGQTPTKKFNNDKRFDVDLAYGQMHEERVVAMLENKKIEVKTERGMWAKTGNIAIEFESYGKPSGIASTEADYWFHNLAINDTVYATLMFDVDVLRTLVEELDDHKVVKGGDNWASKMYLVNLSKLFSTDTVKVFKELESK